MKSLCINCDIVVSASDIRKRRIGKGFSYVFQCPKRLNQVRSTMRRSVAMMLLNGIEPKEGYFDEQLEHSIESSEEKEQKLKYWLIGRLEKVFFIYSEVSGKHLLTGKKVRADFLIKPKRHILSTGFIDGYIVIECKYLNPESDTMDKKLAGTFKQTIDYQQSIFKVNNEVKPAFSLVFSNLSFVSNGIEVQQISWDDQREYIAYRRISNHFKVGTLKYDTDNKLLSFIFGAYEPYFEKSYKRSYAKVKNKNLIKYKIGSQ